jgi:hypothetical protein
MPTYSTFNPSDKGTKAVLSGGDLILDASSIYGSARSTISKTTGKWYVEFMINPNPSDANRWEATVGFANAIFNLESVVGFSTTGVGWIIREDYGTYGQLYKVYNAGTSVYLDNPSPPAWTDGSVIMLAIDFDEKYYWVGCDGEWYGDPGAGTGGTFFSALGSTPQFLAATAGPNGTINLRTNPADFDFTVPTDFEGGWFEYEFAEITAGLEGDVATAFVKEVSGEITAGLGSNYDPFNNEFWLTVPSGFDGVPLVLRDRSPISGGVGLVGGIIGSIGWSAWWPVDQQIRLDCSTHAQIAWYGSITHLTNLGATIGCFSSAQVVRSGAGRTSTFFEFTLTGDGEDPVVADVVIPISSIQARIRQSTPTYLAVQVASYEEIDNIVARTNGTMIVEQIAQVDGVEVLREIIVSAALDSIRTDRGGKNRTITLTGYKTETFAPKLVQLLGVSEIAKDDGKLRVKADIDFFLKPGDTVVAMGETFTAGMVSLSISTRRQIMEVSEL